jgi:O-antigen ligase
MSSGIGPAVHKPAFVAKMSRWSLFIFAWSLPISLFGMQVGMLLGFVIVIGWWMIAKFEGFKRSPVDGPFLVMLVAVGLSWLLAPVDVSSFRMAASFWVWFTLYMVYYCLDQEKTLNMALMGILILSVAVAAFGVFQSFSGLYPIGKLIHSRSEEILSPAFGSPQRYMAVGLFTSRVTFGHLLIFPFCWLSALILERFSWRHKLLIGLGIIIILAGIVCSWSRSALAAAVLAGMGLFMFSLRSNKQRLIGLGVLACVFGTGIVLAPSLTARLTKSFSGNKDWGRLMIWQAGLDMVSKEPASGYGYGNFYDVAQPIIEQKVEKMGAKRFAGRLTWSHNDLINMFSQTGVVGAFGYCWLFVAFFFSSTRGLRRVPLELAKLRGFVKGSIAAVLVFLVTSMAHDHFFHPELSFILWFTLGATLAVVGWYPPEESEA